MASSMFEDLQATLKQAAEENKATMDRLCPKNITSDRLKADAHTVFTRGPHHWVRVGKWTHVRYHHVTDPEAYSSRDGKTLEAVAPYSYRTEAVLPVYECVYCLERKRADPPGEKELPC